MLRRIFVFLILVTLLATIAPVSALDETRTYRSIMKIRTYEYNSTNDTYTMTHIGSAIALGSGRLLTNAHVIFDKDGEKPNGYYEICRTVNFRKKPVCFTSGELVGYDESIDLALLSYREPGDLEPITLSDSERIEIGDQVVMYGYPAIGGENITRSEGNIAGYQDPYYKIDGAVDHGNSGGAALDPSGELIGVPSRVSSDNAVFGYMVPLSTIRDFLANESKQYTKISLPVSESFHAYIKNTQRGERSNDIINDANIKSVSMKKYGLKYIGKIETVSTFLYSLSANNLNESSVLYSCPKVGGALSIREIDERDSGTDTKKYTETVSTLTGGNYIVKKYASRVSTDSSDFIKIFDTRNSCYSMIMGINLTKHANLIDRVITFLTTGITPKKSYPSTSPSLDTQIFHIEKFPTGISILESPNIGGDNMWMFGYFSAQSNTGEKLAYLTQKKRDTLDSYFIGGSEYYDTAPSDENLKSSEYTSATFQKLYEKEYTDSYYSNTKFEWITTKNQKKVLIGTYGYEYNSQRNTTIIIVYPYMIEVKGQKEYYELRYTNTYPASNTLAIERTREFFSTFEPVGTSPF